MSPKCATSGTARTGWKICTQMLREELIRGDPPVHPQHAVAARADRSLHTGRGESGPTVRLKNPEPRQRALYSQTTHPGADASRLRIALGLFRPEWNPPRLAWPVAPSKAPVAPSKADRARGGVSGDPTRAFTARTTGRGPVTADVLCRLR